MVIGFISDNFGREQFFPCIQIIFRWTLNQQLLFLLNFRRKLLISLKKLMDFSLRPFLIKICSIMKFLSFLFDFDVLHLIGIMKIKEELLRGFGVGLTVSGLIWRYLAIKVGLKVHSLSYCSSFICWLDLNDSFFCLGSSFFSYLAFCAISLDFSFIIGTKVLDFVISIIFSSFILSTSFLYLRIYTLYEWAAAGIHNTDAVQVDSLDYQPRSPSIYFICGLFFEVIILANPLNVLGLVVLGVVVGCVGKCFGRECTCSRRWC